MKIYKPTDKDVNTILVFIHGFIGSKETWHTVNGEPKPLLSYLINNPNLKDKFHYFIFEYETSIRSNDGTLKRIIKKYSPKWIPFSSPKHSLPINLLAKNLRTKIKDRFNDYTQIVLICHSMGGLIAKKYINDNLSTETCKKVQQYITLATPHLGSEIADLGHILFENPQVIDLKVLSNQILDLTRSWIKKKSLPERIYFTALQDDIVKFGADGLEVDDVEVKDAMTTHSGIVNPKNKDEDVVHGLAVTLKSLFDRSDGNIKQIRKQLLTAQEEIKNEDKNYVVSSDLKTILKNIDSQVNEIIGAVESPRHNFEKLTFKSNKIIRSLAAMGVPVEVGLKVLNMIIPALKDVTQSGEKLTTFHIRKAVAEALFNLDAHEYSSLTIKNWGTSYSRRYGNPNKRITVIETDGTLVPLNFRYIKSVIIPQIIEKKYGRSYEEIYKPLSINSSLDEMSEMIYEKVKSLGIFNIKVETLITLTTDLATQPPQPWFSDEYSKNTNIIYDLERADRHYRIITSENKSGIREQIRHSSVDCIDHICSAILIYYGLFVGAGRLRPLNNLLKVISELIDSKYEMILNEITAVKNFEGDLRAVNLTLIEFASKLKVHRDYLGDREKNYENLIQSSVHIYNIGLDIIIKEREVERRKTMLSSASTREEYFDTITYYLKFLGELKNYDTDFPLDYFVYYYQFSETPLNYINNRFVIMPLFNFNASKFEFKTWINSMNLFSRKTNTVFFIPNSEIAFLNEIIEELEKQDSSINLYVINPDELASLPMEIDRDNYIFKLIEKNEKSR